MRSTAMALIAGFALAGDAVGQTPETAAEAPPKIRVNGVELHYVVRGTGVPVVFIHGGLSRAVVGVYWSIRRTSPAPAEIP